MNNVTRRQFLATSGVVIAGIWVPDWTEGFQSTSTDAARTEAAEAALAHAASSGLRMPTFASTGIVVNR